VPRGREFDDREVVEAAKQEFWDRGYQGTAVSDIERRTGLNRSSLYLAFGSKRGLFGNALERYEDGFISDMLHTMEDGPAELASIGAYFSAVKAVFLEDPPRSQRGCLMVNTMAELGGRDLDATAAGTRFRDRLGAAFRRALEGAVAAKEIDDSAVERRARFLTAATLGLWLSVRLDVADGADLCDAMTAEVESWRISPLTRA
jgi:TetR/AcrR family transcriptional repressor of nem operon